MRFSKYVSCSEEISPATAFVETRAFPVMTALINTASEKADDIDSDVVTRKSSQFATTGLTILKFGQSELRGYAREGNTAGSREGGFNNPRISLARIEPQPKQSLSPSFSSPSFSEANDNTINSSDELEVTDSYKIFLQQHQTKNLGSS